MAAAGRAGKTVQSGSRGCRRCLAFGGHFRCLHALRALHDLELHPLAFLEAAEALRTDRREMHENVRPAAVRRDETEPLGVVEPLHRTYCHFEDPSSQRSMPGMVLPGAMSIIPAHPARKRRRVTQFAQPARSAFTISGTRRVAAARCAWISSRLIGASGSGPQPAAQLATTAMQA